MENTLALVKPELTSAEKKIIAMVIDGLPSENSRRAYQRHLQDFFRWHALENRPELDKALINRYVKTLRAAKLSSSTINQKLSAIRKLASETEDNDLIDSRLANGIRAVKGVPFRGRRTGNWLTKEDAQRWLNAPDIKTLKDARGTSDGAKGLLRRNQWDTATKTTVDFAGKSGEVPLYIAASGKFTHTEYPGVFAVNKNAQSQDTFPVARIQQFSAMQGINLVDDIIYNR